MTESFFVFLSALTIIHVVDFLLNWIINRRQEVVLRKSHVVPSVIRDYYPQQKFDKSRNYELKKIFFSYVKLFFSIFIDLVQILTYFNAYLYDYSEGIVNFFHLNGNNELLVTGVYVIMLFIIIHALKLPLEVYNTFVLEEMFGFNKQTFLFFFNVKLKKLALGSIIGFVVSVLVVYVMKATGDKIFIYVPIALCVIQIFFMMIYQDYIAPLFDKFYRLESGSLRGRIEGLTREFNFPLDDILVVEHSKRSNHSNAYFIGLFGKKKIVLFDTLLSGVNSDSTGLEDSTPFTEDEIMSILCHELGHWKGNHIFKNFVFFLMSLFGLFYLFGFFFEYDPVYNAFGFYEKRPVIIALSVITGNILAPYNMITNILTTIFSRKCEFEADLFSLTSGYSKYLSLSLIKLHVNNLSFPLVDHIYSFYNHSHPTLLERLDAIEKWKKIIDKTR